jgi:hypothetical protein
MILLIRLELIKFCEFSPNDKWRLLYRGSWAYALKATANNSAYPFQQTLFYYPIKLIQFNIGINVSTQIFQVKTQIFQVVPNLVNFFL